MSFGAATKSCFSKYAEFSGRARRSEFWWWYLFTALVSLPVAILFYVLVFAAFVPVAEQVNPDGSVPSDAVGDISWGLIILGGVLMFVVWLALAIPTYAVWARRLHDMGQTGHWLWLNLASLGIVPLIMAFLDSERGANRWGEDPKAHERPQAPAYGAPGYGASGYAQPGAIAPGYGAQPAQPTNPAQPAPPAAPSYPAPSYPAPGGHPGYQAPVAPPADGSAPASSDDVWATPGQREDQPRRDDPPAQ
ncbi:DUF805 domain-containing protein [Demequina sp. NBRC 110056]|uniref:DUF805 domain-containing protein n=1 Tax=Demequina sp. NBRC 110056 TaxID=1570345 RepID=UPI000A05EC10|nr:DUF805 domain-containing protein [Demequina sp. NBRC 110056]